MALGRQGERQADLMIGWAELPRSPGHAFHDRLHLNGYETFQDVVARLPRFLEEVYDARRPHSALGYVSPVRFEGINTREAA